ncbi:alkanesulfonate monooxygenase SsuD/methylene tetrahydromethanopterin reductase-like flavin-dependent oxidoreductase (luciferase family) [Thermocatellispora tengchongensis]|uniref:Alkanesulfonate monooxygenase SsuD/methylene tetrahydromethanopterin reductase-like flavin-dependent oxidoreductase (Luciferase family) n=1 Tax=Thermocatellispora tengchongensis TaxID=1073253 RepID=A0A840P7J9_9ACTN|nr:LLM class flavin-dependent oxidoreductase [Thermocatellispora tengchongensis]MBB5133410.1 alkanesulfonate monooxygenase SsuD/methylene tetrahydromethanopterin reductase-like flavin-dependent oxidoreductase (luciferase family) [Thermocatellispora tengchongensis]
MVRFAVGLPNVGEFGDPGVLVELGVAAEEHGWDGVFLWDHLLYHDRSWPVANSVVVLSAVAARTRRVRLGVLMTALPRRRVQNVAKETATLDVLSGGRLVVGAGLGSMDAEYAEFGEDPDLRARAAKLDRGLEELTRLWRRLPPAPVQPRIPIWCPGRWPTKAGLRRAARWDGAMPTFHHFGRERPVPVAEFARVVGFLAAERGSLDGFDIALEGRAADGLVGGYAAAGMTWWVEAMGWWRGGVAEARATIAAGPPR